MVAAVLDTGVDYGHADLAASMWTNPGEIPNNGIDDDGNGIVDDYYGIAAFNNGGVLTGDPDDNLPDGGHGTHVAGSIAAPINGVGILGVAPNVKIMGVRVFTYDPAQGGSSAWDTDIARGLNYAIAMKNRGFNIRALNLSLGTCPGASPSNTMLQAYRAVSDAGMLLFFAAGNDSNNNDANLVYPANYNVPLKVTVGATATDGISRADWGGTSSCGYPSGSNYGATTVDIFAPGTSILSTVPTFVDPSGYASWDGTSMATPVTLGAALLTWSANPALSGAQIRSLLLDNGTPSAALAGLCVTGRVVNAAASVAAAVAQPTPTTAPTVTPTRTPTAIPTVAPGPSSGGGGGCSLGFGSLGGLLFLIPLVLMRKSSR
jgi:subtilisin family serine protease